MINLIPAEYWDYKITDILHATGSLRGNQIPGEVIRIPEVGPCIPVKSGRAALTLALKALQMPPGARIGMPLYCCPVVLKAIEAAECTHCFIDIDPKDCCLAPSDVYRKRDQFDALIAVHMFGNTCDMNALREASDGKPIIEDCAQSIGSSIGGRMTGTFGDISFFSFRSGKYISAGEGGALFTSNKKLRSVLIRLVNAMPALNRLEEIKYIASTYIRTKLRSRPLYGLIGHRIWATYNKNADPMAQSSVALGRIYKSNQSVIEKRLPLLPSVIYRQRENAAFYEATLNVGKNMYCIERPGTFYNRYSYPLKLDSPEKRDSLVELLFKRKIGAIQPYKNIVEFASRRYGYKGDCILSERTARTIVALPCHHRLTYRQRRHIAVSVNEFMSKKAI